MNLDVFDGMKGKLTQAHIDKVRDMCRETPVALSIRIWLPDINERATRIVEVGSTFGLTDYEVPSGSDGLLEQWVDDFDKGKKVRDNLHQARRPSRIEHIGYGCRT